MKIFDSNIWVAFLNINDSQHKKANKIFTSLDNGKIIITEYIIGEVATILLFKAGKEIADKFIELVLDNKNIEVLLSDGYIFKDTISRFQQGFKKKLSFIDVSLVCLSDSYEVMTFDDDLKRELIMA